LSIRFGVTHVLNVETEHDDTAKVPPTYKSDPLTLCQHKYQTNGTEFPEDKIRSVVVWLDKLRVDYLGTPKFYVHCQQGGSRSPAFAYLLLRVNYKLDPNGALNSIRLGKESFEYGDHPYHIAYISSVERYLRKHGR